MFRIIPICMVFFVLCTLTASQEITKEQWIKMGEESIQIGSYKEALNAFNKSIELDPKSARAWHDKGNILQKIGMNNDSIKAYDRAIMLDPGFKFSWSNKGNALQDMGLYNDSIEAYDQAIKLDSRFGMAWMPLLVRPQSTFCNKIES